MSRLLTACSVATTLALSITLAAQNPPANPQGQPQTQAPATPSQAAAVTVEGCLVREADVPGRRPNVAERQGIMEDYILTSTKIVKGSVPSSPSAQPDKPTGTAGTTAMFHVKGIDDERLKPLVGKRVQIDGKLQDLDKPATPSPGSEDLADLQADNIRQVSGDCPAAKP